MLRKVEGGWIAGWSRPLAEYDATPKDPSCLCLSQHPNVEDRVWYTGERRYAYKFRTRAAARIVMREFRATREF